VKCKNVIVALFLFFLLEQGTAFAKDYYNPVEPNKYNEQQREIPVEYIHEKELFKRKRRLPPEQHLLTFEPKEKTDLEEIQLALFQNPEEPINSIAIKAQDLQLFAETKDAEMYVMDDEAINDQRRGLTIVFGTILSLITGFLFLFLVPKLNQNSS